MTVLIRRVLLRVKTPTGKFGTSLAFGPGLNLLRGRNSAGKSTVIQALIYALGIEGMLGPSQDVPLHHAMTSLIEDDRGIDHQVLESYVFVELERSDGARIGVRRFAKHPQVDTRLIRVWDLAPGARRGDARDFHVRIRGSAQNELGFHHFLTEWFGWELPLVPKFDGTLVPLYIETIAPLFFVEQKRGWAGVQAQTPTYLQIRDVRKRAIEFLLKLDAISRRSRIQSLEREGASLREEWKAKVSRLEGQLKSFGATVSGVTEAPDPAWGKTEALVVRLSWDGDWQSPFDAQANERAILERPISEARNSNAEQQIRSLEDRLRISLASQYGVRNELNAEERDLLDLEARLAVLKEDLRRHKDIETLKTFGSDLETSLHLSDCPVCHQALAEGLLPVGVSANVMSVDQTKNFLSGQIDLVQSLRQATAVALNNKQIRLSSLRSEISELRRGVVAAKEAAVEPGSLPSLSALERRLTARQRLDWLANVDNEVHGATNWFAIEADKWRQIQTELKALRASDFSTPDYEKLKALELLFLSTVQKLGFTSFSTQSMRISQDDYLPDHDGYNFAFESSASDLIRVIWAYLFSLASVSVRFGANHPGFLVMDEPRQQMTAEGSFVQYLACVAQEPNVQVIIATSEVPERLAEMLSGIDHRLMTFSDRLLTRIV
jgi:AAA domain